MFGVWRQYPCSKCCAACITIPKIMILGIVGENENGLSAEPSSYKAISIRSRSRITIPSAASRFTQNTFATISMPTASSGNPS